MVFEYGQVGGTFILINNALTPTMPIFFLKLAN